MTYHTAWPWMYFWQVLQWNIVYKCINWRLPFCPLTEQQYISDILGLVNHGDPQIRGATAILCAAIIQAALTKTRYNIHTWLASVQSATGQCVCCGRGWYIYRCVCLCAEVTKVLLSFVLLSSVCPVALQATPCPWWTCCLCCRKLWKMNPPLPARWLVLQWG